MLQLPHVGTVVWWNSGLKIQKESIVGSIPVGALKS